MPILKLKATLQLAISRREKAYKLPIFRRNKRNFHLANFRGNKREIFYVASLFNKKKVKVNQIF